MEKAKRLAAVAILQSVCRKLFVDPFVPLCTAVVLLHRFYTRRSMKAHDPKVAAFACLYLASKVDDTRVTIDEVSPKPQPGAAGAGPSAAPAPGPAPADGAPKPEHKPLSMRTVVFQYLAEVDKVPAAKLSDRTKVGWQCSVCVTMCVTACVCVCDCVCD